MKTENEMNACISVRKLTRRTKENLVKIAQWSNYLGVADISLGVIYGFSLLGAMANGATMNMLVAIIGMALNFVFGYNLMGSAKNIKIAVESHNPENLEVGLKKMDVFFKLTGAMIIISFMGFVILNLG